MTFNVIIPARHASTRLPGKPLLRIGSKTMIEHVHDRAVASGATRSVIATDDERIRETAENFGAEVVMTSGDHQTGTDRLAEAVRILDFNEEDIVVNLQGDVPLMPATAIHQVADNMASFPEAKVATLCTRIINAEELFDPNAVKVVLDRHGYALYFSRAPIPWHRDGFADSRDVLPESTVFFRHIGLYAYRAGFLSEFVNMDRCELEQAELLEQLRVMWAGGKIHVGEASEAPGPEIDTQEDLERVKKYLDV